jgi:hypothetical protein
LSRRRAEQRRRKFTFPAPDQTQELISATHAAERVESGLEFFSR